MKQRKFITAVIATLFAGQALALDVDNSDQRSPEVNQVETVKRVIAPNACWGMKGNNLRAHIIAPDQAVVDQATTVLRAYVDPARITSVIDPATTEIHIAYRRTTSELNDFDCPFLDEVMDTTPKTIELQHEYVDSFRQIPAITPAGFFHRRIAGSFIRYAAPALTEGVTATITAKDDAEADQVAELYRQYGAKATFERVIDPTAKLVTIKINQAAN